MKHPDRIGKYEIRGKLGDGATSTVYLGYDEFSAREVAIKVIFPDVLRDKEHGLQYRRLLLTEASLAGKLQHPHIVEIFDAVINDEQSYIVMEYVPGGTLEPFCKPDTLLPIERVVEIIFKCTRALDYANRAGITHRDIKPANILLTERAENNQVTASSGDIKISDFGAALIGDIENSQTQVFGVGSPAYMSPQQLSDQPLTLQTDIYSLGVVMYQLLTGRLPFEASSNFGMIYQICNTEPPPPTTFRIDIPLGLAAVIKRAMQKDLAVRYQSWREFSHDLAQSFRNAQLSVQSTDFPDSEKFETLRTLAFFTEFSDVELWEVVRFSRWSELAPRTVIMKEGEPGDFFAFLLSGELAVEKNKRTLVTLQPGECFGEMAIIQRGQHTRSANIVALTTARVVTIPALALQHSSDACRMHFYQGFLNVIAQRLDNANQRIASG
ncbi:MAG TPA: serine/threonine-protein kinase [Rugosibacter sp.]|nr:serine/threonine-protein kinase [Rugosibacter sp.]HQQ35098.1 serine/threonine-protein kinase [Rugosibacter sp.]